MMSFSIPIHLVRQWCFCPRIVYYLELNPVPVSYPVWVRQGEDFHENQIKLWKRRNLSRFKLEKGKIFHNVSGKSINYGIHGIVDMVIETDEDVFPVEFKLEASRIKRGGLLQLTGYAMILEEVYEKPCLTGFLAEGESQLHRVIIDEEKKKKVQQITAEIKDMMDTGVKPDTPATNLQCTNCEYQNYCNDRT